MDEETVRKIIREELGKDYNFKTFEPKPMHDNHPCKGCSNHPDNGGSGICHCTIPLMNGQGPRWTV